MHNTDDVKVATRGLGLWNLLGLVFITLKLLGEIVPTPIAHWSWIWVTSPIWIPIVFMFLLVAIVAGFKLVK